jgi:hypothetical protein
MFVLSTKLNKVYKSNLEIVQVWNSLEITLEEKQLVHKCKLERKALLKSGRKKSNLNIQKAYRIIYIYIYKM